MPQPIHPSGFHRPNELYDIVGDLFGPMTKLRFKEYAEKVDGKGSYARPRYRLGQAFMNALPEVYYNQLVGSEYDPFFADTGNEVIRAIEYLTDPMAGAQDRLPV